MAAGADGMEASAPPYSKPFPDEILQYYQDIFGCSRRAAAHLQLAARDQRRDPARSCSNDWSTSTPSWPSRTARPNAEQFYETTRRVVGRARVFGPFMTLRGLEVLRTVGGDGFIGGGSLFGPPDGEFWEAFWRGRLRRLRGARPPDRGAVPPALAAGRLGRRPRCLPE